MNPTTRAWKDPVFRAALGEGELATIQAHPLGSVELDTVVLASVYGARTEPNITTGCCNTVPTTSITFITCHWTCWTCWSCEC